MRKFTTWIIAALLALSVSHAHAQVTGGGSGSGLPRGGTNGQCLIISGTTPTWGSCAGSSNVNLGTSVSAASPLINGDATSGFYTAGAGLVDVAISGANIVQWDSTGEVITGILSASGNLAIATNKFTVAAASGNTVIGGTLTLGSGGNIAVNTNKFLVTASSGATTIAGNLTTNVTGSTQCLKVNSSGVVSGTGGDCSTALLAGNNLSDVSSVATSRANIGVDQRSQKGSASYSVAVTDHYVTTCNKSDAACSANTWNAPATWTLPAYNTVNDGDTIVFADDPAVVTNVNTLSVAPNTGDTINNSASASIVNSAGTKLTCQLDATNRNWTCVGSLPNGTSSQMMVGQGATSTPAFLSITGDWNISTLGAVVVDHVNSVSYPNNTAANEMLIATASRTMGRVPLADCTDTGGNHLNFSTTTHLITCGTSSAGGVSSGTAGQLGWYSSTGTTISGNANVTASSGVLTLGQAGSVQGSAKLSGATSGTLTLAAPAAASGTITFPAGTTDFTATGGSSNFLKQAGAGSAITVAQPAFSDISGTAAVNQGGTGLTSGTSGGVLAYTASGTLASSGTLTANLPVIGGGSGVAPTVGTVTGNTTKFATFSGAATSGKCVDIDGSGNLEATGSACGTGGGGGSGTPATGNTTAVTVNANTASDQILQELHPADASFNTANMELALHQSGIYNTAAASTVSVKAKLCTQTGGGGTCITLGTITSTATTAASSSQFFIDLRCGVKTTGATGNLLCHGLGSLDLAGASVLASTFTDGSTAASSNFDLTGANFIVFTVAFASASASNTMTAQNAYVSAEGYGGTVTSVATSSPITGGPITATGTIACATCVTSAASLTSGQMVTGSGSQGSQTNSDATFSAGTLTLGANGSEAGAVKMYGSTSGNLTVKAAAAAGTNTTLTLPGGTTDLSATGGTSQVLKQASAGAAITVGQLACSDLSNAAASCSTDATNAGNISAGTLAVARGGTGGATGLAAAGNLSHVYTVTQTTTQSSTHTGDTAETKLGSCTIPAGLMATNGTIRWTALFGRAAGAAGNITPNIRWGAANDLTGTSVASGTNALTTSGKSNWKTGYISNRNSASSQVMLASGASNTNDTNAIETAAVNTANASYVVFSATNASAADTSSLEMFVCEYLPPGGN